MLTIKLVDVRMMVLRAAMKKEEQRLQNVADQVARIAAGLDMDLKSSAGIDEILAKLRKNLKKQSNNWAVMQQLAEQAAAELHQKDADVARKAKGLDYSARQFAQSVQTTAFSSAAGGKLVQDVAHPSLGLSALNKLDLTQELGELFGGIGRKFGDALQGVSLGELSGDSLTASLNGVLDRIEVEDVLTAAGAGVAGMAGIMGLTALFDSAKPERPPMAAVKIPTSLHANTASQAANALSGYNKSAKGEKKDVLDYLGEGFNWVADKAEDAGEAVWGGMKWVGEKAVDAGEAAWDGMKWVGEKAVDTGEAIWNGMLWLDEKSMEFGETLWNGAKAVAESKPVEYLWDMGGSVIGGGADILSFCGNVATLQWGDAVADGYSFINNFFDFAQDGSALFIYGMGAGAEALGVDQSKLDYLYGEAEDYHNRNGLAGELHAEGLDTAGTVVDGLDWVEGTYKTVTGFNKLHKGEVFKKGQSWKEYLNTGFGWKTVDDLADTAEYADQVKYYSDLASNVDTGFKYVDGFKEEGLMGLLKTVWDESVSGKNAEGAKKSLSGLGDLFTWAADQN